MMEATKAITEKIIKRNVERWRTNIPKELQGYPQWVNWKLEERRDRLTKVPINPKTGKNASPTNPDDWDTFERVIEAYKRNKVCEGIGFVFTEQDPFCGVDIDADKTGEIDVLDDDRFTGIMDALNSYTEYSQSGKGVHTIIKGELPSGKSGRQKEQVLGTGAKLEIYSFKRYFVMTGDRLEAYPQDICNRQKQLDKLYAELFPVQSPPSPVFDPSSIPEFSNTERTDEEIIRMVQGSDLWQGIHQQSQSEGDYSLCCWLAKLTRDTYQIDRIFRQSGLFRSKWNEKHGAQTYGQLTICKALDATSGQFFESSNTGGGIDISALVSRSSKPDPEPEPKHSWDKVTTSDVRQAIKGTTLEPLVRLLEAPMKPRLHEAITIPKALVLAGCALAGRRGIKDDPTDTDEHKRGSDLARLCVRTAGGQVCNVYALILANSGHGKDVGNLADRLAIPRQWMIGNAGSAEGLADTLSDANKIDRSNGLLSISEFGNWLDGRHWQAKAASFLTSAFNKGYFSVMLSARNSIVPRQAKYCYPSILANIQPKTFARITTPESIETGFLGRFLLSVAPNRYYGRPRGRSFDEELPGLFEAANQALNALEAKSGNVDVGDDCLPDLFDEFRLADAPFESHWKRLINEYGPRFAVMLSVKPDDSSTDVVLTSEAWDRAATLIRWFYKMASSVVDKVEETEKAREYNLLLKRVFAVVKKFGPCGKGKIGEKLNGKHGYKAKDRLEALTDLVERGLLQQQGIKYSVIEGAHFE